jgi:transcriptional regulator with XRE-family HTH domain
MEVNLKDVGNRIKNIRISRGDSMESFGKKLDTSKAAVNNWEKGVNLPNNSRVKKIAELGNISVNELLFGPFETYARNYIDWLTHDTEFKAIYRISDENRKDIVDKTMYQVLKKGIAKDFYDIGELDAADYNLRKAFSDTGIRKIMDTDFTNFGAWNNISMGIAELMRQLEEYQDNGVDGDVYRDLEKIIENAHEESNALYEKYKGRLKK